MLVFVQRFCVVRVPALELGRILCVLDAHDVRDFFSVVRIRGSSGKTKTAMVGEIMAAIEARPAVLVGDRHDDVEAAHAHGAFAVGAGYGFGGPDELSDADVVVGSAAEIPEAVRMLIGRPQSPR